MPEVAVRYANTEMQRLLRPVAGPELVGYSSLAVGADQMFAEVVLAFQGQLRLVIPSRNYASTFANYNDLDRYERLLTRAATVETLDFAEPSEEAFFAAGREIVAKSDWLIAVWDGAPAQGLGGSADVVAYARAEGKDVTVVWPEGVARTHPS
jgi:hypothetical protein